MFNLPPKGARRGDPAAPMPEVPNHAAPVPTCHSRRRRMPGVSHPTTDGTVQQQHSPSAPSAIHATTAPRDSSKENYTPTELDGIGLGKLHQSSSVVSVPEAQRLTSPKKLNVVDLPRPRCSSLESNSRRPQSRSSATTSMSRSPPKRDSSKEVSRPAPTNATHSVGRETTPIKVAPKVAIMNATTPSKAPSTSPSTSNVPSWTVTTTSRTGPIKAHTPVRHNPTDTFDSRSTPVSRPKGPAASSTATYNHPTAAPMKDAHSRRRPAPQFPPHHEDVSVGGVGPATPMKVATTDEPSPSPEAAQKSKPKPKAAVVPMVSQLDSVECETTPPTKAPLAPAPTAQTVVSPPPTKKSVPLAASGPQSAAVGEAQKLPSRKGGGGTVGSLTGQSQRRNTSMDTVLNYRHSEDSPSSAASNARSSPSPAWPKTLPSGKRNSTATHLNHPGGNTPTSIHVLVDPSNMEGAPAQGLPRLQRSSMVPARTVPVVEPSLAHQPAQPSRESSEKRRAPSSSSAHRGDPQEEDGDDTSHLPVFSQIGLDEEESVEDSSDEGTILRESF